MTDGPEIVCQTRETAKDFFPLPLSLEQGDGETQTGRFVEDRESLDTVLNNFLARGNPIMELLERESNSLCIYFIRKSRTSV